MATQERHCGRLIAAWCFVRVTAIDPVGENLAGTCRLVEFYQALRLTRVEVTAAV